MLFTTEGLFEVAIESWPEWDLIYMYIYIYIHIYIYIFVYILFGFGPEELDLRFLCFIFQNYLASCK